MATIKNIFQNIFETKGARSAATSTDTVTKAQTRLGNSSAAAGRQFSAQSRGLGGLVGVYAGAAANIFAITQAFAALQRAAQAEQTIAGLNSLAASVGRSSQQVLASIRDITAGQLSIAESAQAANLALSAGLGQSFEGLTNVANKASRALGRDLLDSFQRVVRGTAKLEPELLDELGIFVRIEPAVEKYAKSLGRSASSLTEFERRQAFANAVIEEGNQKFKDINTFSDTSATSLSRLQASFADLTQSVLSVIADGLVPLAEFFSQSLGNKILLAVGIFSIVFATLKRFLGDFITTSLTQFSANLDARFSQIKAGAAITSAQLEQLGLSAKKALVGVGAFSGQGRAGIESGKFIKESAAELAAGTLGIRGAQEAEKAAASRIVFLKEERTRLLELAVTQARGSEEREKTQKSLGKVRKQLQGVTVAQEAFNKRVQAGTLLQKLFATAIGGVQTALTGLASFASKALSFFSWVGVVITAVQLLGDAFGVDLVGSITKFFSKFGEESRNFRKGIQDLVGSSVNDIETFGLSLEKLKDITKEVSSDLQTVLKEQKARYAELINLSKDSSKRTLAENQKLISNLDLTSGSLSLAKEIYEKYSKEIEKGGEAAKEAAIKIALLNEQTSLLERGGRSTVVALSQIAATTGKTTGQLKSLVEQGMLKFDEASKMVTLTVGETTTAIAGANGSLTTFGALGGAAIIALTSSITDANNEFNRGAVNAEGASKSLVGLNTSYNSIKSTLNNLLGPYSVLTEEQKDQVRLGLQQLEIQKQQINSYSELATKLQQQEKLTKQLEKQYKSGISTLEDFVFSGIIGADLKIAETPEEKRLNAAKSLISFLNSPNYEEGSSSQLEREKQLSLIIRGSIGNLANLVGEAKKLNKTLTDENIKIIQEAFTYNLQQQLKLAQLNLQVQQARQKIEEDRRASQIKLLETEAQLSKAQYDNVNAFLAQQNKLSDLEKERLDIQQRITKAQTERAAIQGKRADQAQLAGLQSQLAEAQDFSGLTTLEEVRTIREQIALKEFDIQMKAIAEREKQIRTEEAVALREIDRQTTLLERESEIAKNKQLQLEASIRAEDVLITKRRELENLKTANEIKNLESQQGIVSLEKSIAQDAATNAYLNRIKQLELLEIQQNVINEEFENNKSILKVRAGIVEQEAKNIAAQARLQGQESIAKSLENNIETFSTSIEDQLSKLSTSNNLLLEDLNKKSYEFYQNQLKNINDEAIAKSGVISSQIEGAEAAKNSAEKLRAAEDKNRAELRSGQKSAIQNELDLLNIKLQNNNLSKTAIQEETLTKLEGLGLERDAAKQLLEEKLANIARERAEFEKLFNSIANIINTRLSTAVSDLFNAIKEGTLTSASLKDGIKTIFRDIVFGVAEEAFKQQVLVPIQENVKAIFGGIVDEITGKKGQITAQQQRLFGRTDIGTQTTALKDIFGDIVNVRIVGQTGAILVTDAGPGLGFGFGAGGGIAPSLDVISQVDTFGEIQKDAAKNTSDATSISSEGLLSLGNVSEGLGSIFRSLGGVAQFAAQGLGSLLGGALGGGPVGSFVGSTVASLATQAIGLLFASGGLVSNYGAMQRLNVGGPVKHFAGGGMQRDSVPALLEPGEFVLRKTAVNAIGASNLERMNATGKTTPSVKIKVENTGAPKEAEQGETTFDGEAMIVKLILKDLKSNGPIRKSIRANS